MASRVVGGPKTRRMLKRFPADAKAEVVKALDQSIRLVQATAVGLAPSRTGTLKTALGSSSAVGRRDQGLRVEFGLRTKALRKRAFYGPFVEYGAKGFTAKALPANRRGNKGQTIRPAWPARKVGNRAAHPFLAPALDRNMAAIRARVNVGVRAAIVKARHG